MAVESALQDHEATIRSNVMFVGQGTAHKKKTSRTGNHSRTYWKKVDVALDGPVQISQTWRYRLWNRHPFTRSVANSAHSHFMNGMKRVIEHERIPSIQSLNDDITKLTTIIRDAWEAADTEAR